MQVTASMKGWATVQHNLEGLRDAMVSDEGQQRLTRTAAEAYASFIRREHVSGQRLKVRSGMLRGDIVSRSVSGTNDAVATAGTNRYSRIHDLGYDNIAQKVRAHRRVNSLGNGFVSIGEYTRHAHQDARRYFSDAVVYGNADAQAAIDVVVADFVRLANGG